MQRRRLALLYTILIPHGLPYLARYLRSLSVFAEPPEPDDSLATDERRPPGSRRALAAGARAVLDALVDSVVLARLASELGLALFFLRGGPLEWGKRLAGIRYVRRRLRFIATSQPLADF